MKTIADGQTQKRIRARWRPAARRVHVREAASPQAAFPRFARHVSRTVGHASAFVVALVIIAVWAVTGPLFGFSDTWQLVINTGTTVITFLMVFVIQHTQNRESEAMHLKLDELIRAAGAARNDLLDIEELTESELDDLRVQYSVLARAARARNSANGPRKARSTS